MEADFLEFGMLYCIYCKKKYRCKEFMASHTDIGADFSKVKPKHVPRQIII